MKPVEIADGIYWVGVIDWNIRDFHGYSTHLGSTYNAYLIMDEKITLIDTVKSEFTDDFLEKISAIVDPAKIDYVISNHTEMDHSGGLPQTMKRIGEDKPVFCSRMGHKNLSMHFTGKFNYTPVEDRGSLSLGKRSLTFLETRMLHWPDSMFTYVNENGILFSSDAFGQHYASVERFDDQLKEDIMPHAKKYFANILLLYSPLILKLVDRLKAMNLSPAMICPDHGVMFRENLGKIVNAYVEWSLQRPKRKAVIVYDTMWHSTERMAFTIAEAMGHAGVDVRPMHLRKCDRSDIITEVLDAGAVIIGSPTLNNGLFPTVSDFLTYMKGLKPRDKIGAAFGSYGWSGESVDLVNRALEDMKFNVLFPGLKIQYVPDYEGIATCKDFAEKIAQKLPLEA
ncbi:MAG: flavodoxin domain-containing protein [Deltaproteobacteria bacterium]|nr:flavodoxin domain-containing protein [Deltaproteobacteria bacterium]